MDNSEFNNVDKSLEQLVAFQRIWLETMTKTMQAAFTMAPTSSPPDLMRQLRNGVFQAMAQSWEEFMRSPQFLEVSKQWMENAVTARKMTNDFMAKIRNELQAPSREDMDSILLTIRHMERRLLDRMDSLEAQLNQPRPNPAGGQKGKTAARTAPAGRKPAGKNRSDAGEVEIL